MNRSAPSRSTVRAPGAMRGGSVDAEADRSRLSFQGHWYTCPGLLSRLAGREFEIYYALRDISVIYLFVEGSYVGEAYCQAFMGQRVSKWEAAAQRRADAEKAKAASAEVRSRMQEEIEEAKKQRRRASRTREQERQFDRQREEIHLPHVLETLESLAPDAAESLRLPKATTDPPKEHPVQHLAIRYRDREMEP